MGVSSEPGCFLCQFDARPCAVGVLEGTLAAVHQQRPNGRWQRRIWLRLADGRQMALWLGADFGALVEALAALPKAVLQTLTLRAYHLELIEGTDSAYRATPATILTLEPDVLLSITDLNEGERGVPGLQPWGGSAATFA